MKEFPGTTGLVLNEPLLWEKGREGRCAMSLPSRDVEPAAVDEVLLGDVPDLPGLSEVDVVRHYTRLSQWNFGVDSGMYPLGSCTMKYNPKLHEHLASLPGLAHAHPLLPGRLSQGALRLMFELERFLAEITGMDAVSLQPAAGAHGELAGMLMMHAFHTSQGRSRHRIIVPDTAHGTNPASAALCGYEPVKVKSGVQGILDPAQIARVMDEDTVGIMVTNPNTLGLFEEHIKEIADLIHEKGGLVYCDGANMNALMGVGHMGKMGVDVLHLNLHKTFSTPHGGGGPGAGPICVTGHLERFLPVPRVIENNGSYVLSEEFPDSIGRLHAFYGSFGVMIKAYSYILTMGPMLKRASQLAVLNANYVKEMLKDVFHLAYDRPCMHECVFSDKFHRELKITTLDIAKRLIDYGFHPPTIYFPLVVSAALMIEPAETESKENLDLFIEALKNVIQEAKQDPDLVKQAPHRTKVRRLDETAAARKPCLTG
ncbi:MAG: aminomethyl-transferring glycine dehydrogenase subunit GcvPB [Deltaproteobacteria bacterium]|nr:aminomethyl-transferring glycine dehydrogenase subunit GcvPB [Deltaproteobacteria bacterium]